ncbi:hypothetical protein ACO2Q0_03020 [Phenylobacterium sp. VNQ135]|uniref:hypothetical protein n=1 Tax=Phenylobacterium sp. VNQ135 TaxID=3400922 RepID=UPI003C095827
MANGGTGATTGSAARLALGAAADDAVVKLTGNQTIAGVKTFSSEPFVDRAAGFSKGLALGTGGSMRWYIGADGSFETGGNVGTTWGVARYTDAGAYIDTPLQISRSTGQVVINTSLVLTGAGGGIIAAPRSGSGSNIVVYNPTGTSLNFYNGSADFMAVTTGGALTITSGMTAPGYTLAGAAGTFRLFAFTTAGLNRFVMGLDNAAEGSNAGSNFFINLYNDAGAFVSQPLQIIRGTGRVVFSAAAGVDAVGPVNSGSYVKPGMFTVATLPSASVAGAGALANVSDATSNTRGATATGGGSTSALVRSNGANWLYV